MPAALVIRIVIWGWLLAVLYASQSRWLAHQPLSLLPGLLVALTALLVLAYRRVAGFRAWVDGLDLRALVLLHGLRLIGAYFLLLYRRGELPYAFALPGGIGDTLIAVAAIVLAFAPMAEATRARATYIWNVAGVMDLVLVVLGGFRVALADETQLLPLTVLPLSLLPLFVAPLVLASHLAIFGRLARAAAETR